MEYNNQESPTGISNKYTIPVAIIIAGALVAGALYFSNKSDTNGELAINTKKEVSAVSSDDHILGDPNASIIIVEYSDFECPYCKDYHNVLHQIIDEYGAGGDVAWVYRHFPITQLHSKAVIESEASECAADIGGNQAFWDYADKIYEITPSNNNLDLNQLPIIAKEIGLDEELFQVCLENRSQQDKVQADFEEIVAIGGRGTPHSVIFMDGQQASIEGGQSYEAMKRIIESLLNNSGTESVPSVSNF